MPSSIPGFAMSSGTFAIWRSPEHRTIVALRKCWRRCTRNIATLLAMAFLVAVAGAPALAPYDPLEQNLQEAFVPPGREHWLGTDRYGQDVFSRIVYGSRLSLAVGFFSVLLGLTVGTGIGFISGYVGHLT